MAKKTGRPKGDRDDVAIKVSRPIAAKARALATDRGVPVAQIIDELLEGPIGRAYAKMLQRNLGEE